MPTIISFADALRLSGQADSKGKSPARRLLVGNGFSIACVPGIFTYSSLLEETNFEVLSPYVRTLFDRLNTPDFEQVIKALDQAAVVAEHYATTDSLLASKLRADSQGLKEQLAQTIAKRHPEHPDEIPLAKYIACRKFLSNFTSFYSLNYDLLLYWTMMREEAYMPFVPHDDGFRKGDLGDCGYVRWDAHEAPSQTVTYLHGALHLYDGGQEFVKFTWKNTNVRLIEQIRQSLEEGRFPRIVTEGTWEQKLEQITHCAYLHKGLRSLQAITGDLFILGMAMTDNDDHILDCLPRGKMDRIFVGVFGDPASPSNASLIARAERLVFERSQRNPNKSLGLHFFDAASAKPWG